VDIDELGQLTLEHLRILRSEMVEMRRELGSGLAQVSVEIAAMVSQVAGLTTAVYSGHSRMDDFERRLSRVERRLALRDAD
jgi:hypothetical protein